MTQQRLSNNVKSTPSLCKPYSRGPYNKYNGNEQWIRISEGCPNGCEYCRETFECGTKPIYFEIPEIIRNNVKILDMNLLYKPEALDIINDLGNRKVENKVVYYELVCGIDYRYLTLELAQALKKSRFINIRLAWDHGLEHQYKIKDSIVLLQKVGYSSKSLMIFILGNWRVPYKDCCIKLDLMKIWNVKVADCWFDNQLSPNIKPVYWTHTQIKEFRRKCRKHNQMVNFGIDPEI